MDKIFQIYKAMLVHHMTEIVGPTRGGKTLVHNMLVVAAKSVPDKVVKVFVRKANMLPIADSGTMDLVTRDWTDGVLSKLFRELNHLLPTGKESEMRWLIDGDGDAVWVENRNTVCQVERDRVHRTVELSTPTWTTTSCSRRPTASAFASRATVQ